MPRGIPLKDVAKKYNSTKVIWNVKDYWHFHLHKRYKVILAARRRDFTSGYILNIGSANESYGIKNTSMIYLDAAARSLPRNRLAICGDAHRLPFQANAFQSAIAIGSVLNYCAPAEFFNETARVLSESAFLIFDFEQSGAYEQQGTDHFDKKSALFQTEFNDLDECIWIFRQDHIIELLRAAGFRVIRKFFIHSLSSLVWRLTKSDSLTAAACWLDPFFSKIPVFRYRSSSVCIIAQKTSSKSA